MSRIYSNSGGYRKLHTFNFATIIHLGTISFCKRYIPWKEDPLGKTLGQMIGASRSGKQNIIEGSERAKTSSETEIKLTDVAKASLSELQGDLEDYLVQKGSIPWSIHDPDHKAVVAIMLEPFEYTDDLLLDLSPEGKAQIRPLAGGPGRHHHCQCPDHPDPADHRPSRPAAYSPGKRFRGRRRHPRENVPGSQRGSQHSRQPHLPAMRQAHAKAHLEPRGVLGLQRLSRL